MVGILVTTPPFPLYMHKKKKKEETKILHQITQIEIKKKKKKRYC